MQWSRARPSALLLLLCLLSLSLSLSLAQTAPAGCSAAAGTCVRIGYFRCTNPEAGRCIVAGQNELSDWYIARVNQELGGRINGVPAYFVAATMSATSDSQQLHEDAARASFFQGGDVTKPLVDFVILPPGSNWESTMVNLLEDAQIPSIAANSPLSTLYQCPSTMEAAAAVAKCAGRPNQRRFAYVSSMSSPGEVWFQSWVSLLKLKKASSIGIVQTTVPLYQTIQQGVVTAANDFEIPVTYTRTVPLLAGGNVAQEHLDSVIGELENARPDGLVLSTQNCEPWISAFAARDYAPPSLAAVLCVDNTARSAALGSKMNYVVGSAQWSSEMKGNDYNEDADTQPWALFPYVQNGQVVGPSAMQFQERFQQLLGADKLPGYAEAAILVGFTMLEGALHLAPSVAPAAVQRELELYYQSSFFGLLSTNRYGINQQKAMVINQRDGDFNLGIVSPPSAATLDFIYPMPRFSERHYSAEMLENEVEYVVIALMVACALFTLGLMAYLFLHRNQQVFQAAGLPFYLMMGLGCLVAYGSVLVWGVENNSQSCSARIWLWTVCFHMFVDPMLASSWRISRIFSQKLQTVKLTNRMVGAICLALFAPQLLINALWHSLAPLEPSIVTADPLRPGPTSFTTCSAGDNGVIFAGVTLGYSALLLVASCYLAYKIRKAYRLFNDAKPIALSMYIFTVTAAIILVIQVALDNNTVSAQKVLFGLRSVGVLIAYQSSVALLYGRRIFGQVDVSKYQGNKSTLDDDSDDTTTGTSVPVRADGKLGFHKSEAGASRDSQGLGRNVHVHIQPPASGGGSLGPPSHPQNTPSRSVGLASSTVGLSALQLDGAGTPKPHSHGAMRLKPGQGIITLPAPIQLPAAPELAAMDGGELQQLLQQVHAQNQVLRSHIRSQNLTNAALARGEAPPHAHRPSLPGTPDRSPRMGTQTPGEGVSRGGSFVHNASSSVVGASEGGGVELRPYASAAGSGSGSGLLMDNGGAEGAPQGSSGNGNGRGGDDVEMSPVSAIDISPS